MSLSEIPGMSLPVVKQAESHQGAHLCPGGRKSLLDLVLREKHVPAEIYQLDVPQGQMVGALPVFLQFPDRPGPHHQTKADNTGKSMIPFLRLDCQFQKKG
jgi:hypothetical protein